MSYSFAVTFSHEQTEGYWCSDCVPTEDTSKCGYCHPEIPTDMIEYTDDHHYICTEVIETTEEMDVPSHCIECSELLDNDLTDEGEQYVREWLSDFSDGDSMSPVTKSWAERWPELMPCPHHWIAESGAEIWECDSKGNPLCDH